MTQLSIAEHMLANNESCVGISCTGADHGLNAGVPCPFRSESRATCSAPAEGLGGLATWVEKHKAAREGVEWHGPKELPPLEKWAR